MIYKKAYYKSQIHFLKTNLMNNMVQDFFQGYGPKTLVSGWNYSEKIEKDFDAYDPPGGNQFRSSFTRFGSLEPTVLKTETTSTQWKALVPQKICSTKPLINMISYSSTLGEARSKHWKDVGITLLPDTFDCTNYESIAKSDYINFYPVQPVVKCRALIQKPETKYRRLLVDGSDPRRSGFNTFFDDNQDYVTVRRKERGIPPYGLCYVPQPYY